MLALVCSAMLCSCQKEDVGATTTLNLFTEESSTGDSKLAVDGLSMHWCNRDIVRINSNGVYGVTVSGNGATVTAQYSTVPFSTPLRAVSPDISYSPQNITGDQYQVRLPSTYEYATTTLGSTEVQHLATPMAAYTVRGNDLHFKYLTGALTVKLYNSRQKNIYIEDITITSNSYQLSGLKTIDFTELENIQPCTTSNEFYRSVTMKCNRMVVTSGTTLPVQIPVLPVGSDNCFTVKVRYITEFDGTIASGATTAQLQNYYTFSKTQTARTSGRGNCLGRGELGYVTVELKEESSPTYHRDFLFKDEDGYYLISTPMELKWLSTLSNTNNYLALGQKVKLTNDIDMSGQTYFIPIKKVIEFDGKGKTISNLNLWSISTNCSGLLKDESSSSSGYTGITVKNLTMNNCTLKIQVSTAFAGFVVGLANQNATITNCRVNNSNVEFVTSSTPNVLVLDIGGICGRVVGVAALSECRVEYLRFIVGDHISAYNTLNCGGLIGYNNAGSIEDCAVIITANSGDVIKNTKDDGVIHFGGFVGYQSSRILIKTNTAISVCSVNINRNLTVRGTKSTSTVYAGAFCGSMPSGYQIALSPHYLSNIITQGSFTVNTVTAANKYIGSSSNSYVCGSGNSYYEVLTPDSYTLGLNLTIN